MLMLLGIFLNLLSSSVHSKELSYDCDFIYKTLSENSSLKNQKVTKTFETNINKEMKVFMTIDKNQSALAIREFFKEERKNFIEYSFSCDKGLSCSGSYAKVIDGKNETEKLDVVRNITSEVGKLGSRELLIYQDTISGFKYQYIIYRKVNGDPMGLTVSCRSKT